MSKSSTYKPEDGPSPPQPTYDPNPPTVAAFSPATLSGSSAASKQRSTVIVHKKSPLLVATPPQVTRALAYSHPFLLPLNKFVGLLSWSTDDPWESFLLVAGFWAATLYGGHIIQYAGPVIVVTVLIMGMYSRRYSPLSSRSQPGEQDAKGHKRDISDSSSLHHKSLDEIVETLREFTNRCNLLLDPFLRLTDFLSTQRSATSATTRPALTTLFIRILLVTPMWIALTLPPFYVLTPRRVILTFGTLALTWHSRPARVSRVILWRSLLIRRVCSFVTGLSFAGIDQSVTTSSSLLKPLLPTRRKSQINLASEVATNAKRRPQSSGVRFTFILYENQRRWIGLGWTTSLFAYERGPWTDEHLNPAPSRDEFDLPEVEGGMARWRWIDGSTWRIENGDAKQHQRSVSSGGKIGAGGPSGKETPPGGDGGGWIYYDNKWDDGRREDGWGRYARRRKWYRDAELVEAGDDAEATPMATDVESEKKLNLESRPIKPPRPKVESVASYAPSEAHSIATTTTRDEDPTSAKKRKGWFGGAKEKIKEKEKVRERSDSKGSSNTTGKLSLGSVRSRDGPEDDHVDHWRDRERSIASGGPGTYGVGEDVVMGLS